MRWVASPQQKHTPLPHQGVDFLLQHGFWFSSWRGRMEKEGACLLSFKRANGQVMETIQCLSPWQKATVRAGFFHLPPAASVQNSVAYSVSQVESSCESINERLEAAQARVLIAGYEQSTFHPQRENCLDIFMVITVYRHMHTHTFAQHTTVSLSCIE